MSDLKQTLLSTLSQYPDLPIAIAYSGGVDSQVLLSLVAELIHEGTINNSVLACHINHGLSENADRWQAFTQECCNKSNIPFAARKVSLDLTSKESLEAQARNARYQALIDMMERPAIILTGHHKDDQAETFLLALKRGAGVKGLGAMQSVTQLAHHTLARPLLTHTRKEIEQYAHQRSLKWIEDDSNTDIQFDRNFIRHQVLPVLSQRWPGIIDTVSRSALHCQQSQTLLDELAELDLNKCIQDMPEACLNIFELKKLSEARFNNTMRYFLSTHQCLMASTAQLEQVHAQLSVAADKVPQIKVGDKWLRRFKDKIYLTKEFDDLSNFFVRFSSLTDSDNTIDLPDGLGKLSIKLTDESTDENVVIAKHKMDLDALNGELCIQFTHDNPNILPSYRDRHRPLKKVLQELNIPAWERKRTPFIFSNEQLVVAVGQFVCQPFMSTNQSKSIYLYWLKPEKSS